MQCFDSNECLNQMEIMRPSRPTRPEFSIPESLLSTGLGRAPPKVITIEFDPEDVEAFIQVADAIEEAFPKVIVNGNEDGPGRPGSFEVRGLHYKQIHYW